MSAPTSYDGRETELRSGALLAERFAHWAAKTPAAIAVECGGTRLSYDELQRAAAALSDGLAAAGIGRGDRVALFLPPSLDAVIAMLALNQLRAAYVPLDTASPVARLERIVADAGPTLCLTEEGGVPWPLPQLCPAADCAALAAAPAAAMSGNLEGAAPDDLAYVLYTSGSTGVPKGVCVPHSSLVNLYSGIAGFSTNEHDCWSQLHALTFGYAQWEIWGALSHGGRLCIVPADERADPARWDSRLRASGVTVLSLTPSGLRQWLAADVSALSVPRYLVLSGEALHQAELTRWFARQHEHDVRLLNTYALTETAGCVASVELLNAADPADCVGAPVASAELVVMDLSGRQPVADGQVGELWVAGPMLAAGYDNAPELSAECFVEHAAGDGTVRRFYRTGDHVRRDSERRLRYVGRADGQIKLRGHRIELAEIERALLAHPAVGAAVAVLSRDAERPELRAFAVPVENSTETALQFWPSLGEYQVYDALLYDLMAADATRVASYQRAFARHAAGKVVLDIGTGKDALLARLCVAAGARHVYAVEVLEDAAAAARELIKQLGLEPHITVLNGAMDTVQLPEPIEVCTQGIVGNIGSSDGIVPIWNAARRWFAPDCVAVPERCVTLIAPAELPPSAHNEPRFGPLAADYLKRVFTREGREFDVRLCLRNFPKSGLLAAPAEFEQLDFSDELTPGYQAAAEFTVLRDARMDGLVLWTRLLNAADPPVDFLDHQQAWLPVWFPLQESLDVRAGESVRAEWTCSTLAGQVFPDYAVTVSAQRANGSRVESVYVSGHHETRLGQTALHRQLLAGLEDTTTAPDAAALRTWLQQRLPDYMLPQHIRLLDALPLNASRKVDRESLRGVLMPDSPQVTPGFATAFEEAIAGLWSMALAVPAVGRDDNFFDAGGDSIAAVRLTTAVQRYLDETVFLTTLYESPTVARYCAALTDLHGDAVLNHTAAAAQPVNDTLPADVAQTVPERIQKVQPEESGLLSYAQQSLWFLQQLYPDNTAGSEQFVLRLTSVDLPRVQAAWVALLERHAILRTYFAVSAAGEPRQFVTEQAVVEQTEVDLREADAAALRRLAAAELARPFDLGRPPLLRVVWARTANADWALLVTAHHIIADGLCIELIRDELLALYQGDSLPPSQPYQNFVAAQRQQVTGAWLAAELDWWRGRLTEVSSEPPATRHASATGDAPERRVEFVVPAMCADGLRQLAAEAGVSLFVVLASVWRVWAARCRGQSDVLLGTPVTLRNTTETAAMLGCLVNNVALRNTVDYRAPFIELVRAEHTALLETRDHALVPFEQVVAAVDAPRVLGRHPLFQVFLQYEQVAKPAAAADGATFAADVLPVDRASYWDMELAVRDHGAGEALQAFFGFRSDLYPAEELESWPAGLTATLQAIVANPEQRVGELPLLSAEQQAERRDWNSTDWPVPDSSLAQLFAARAQATPEAPALICGVSGHWTYAALLARAELYVNALLQQGVQLNSRVAVAVAMEADVVALLLAINHLGAVWVPLDPEYPSERLTAMLRAAHPQLVVIGEDEAAARGCAGDVASEGARITLTILRAGASATPITVPPAVAGMHCCALFTSGSTGAPKGALVAQSLVLSRCLWMWSTQAFTAAVVGAQRTSLNFIDSLWETFGPLLHGASVALADPAVRRDARQLADWVIASEAAHLVVVPALLHELLQYWSATTAPARLQFVICSGEALSPELVQRFRDVLPDARLLNTYGTSETWDISAQRVDNLPAMSVVPVGKPVANTRAQILDERLQPLPLGVLGELYANCLVAPAYLDNPELTARSLHRLPDSEDDWYATGDLGFWDALGRLHVAGRRDRQLKLRGVRIEPGEVEAAAMRSPSVAAAALTRTAASEAAGIHGWLTLYLVPATTEIPRMETVRDWLREQLPAALVPADLIFVPELLRTPSGKLDFRALEALAPKERGVARAATAVEEQLLAIWRAALDRSDIALDDDFFALRGNSLLATRVIARICDEFSVELPLAALFARPTVAGLAQTLELLIWSFATGDEPDANDGAAAASREVVRL